MKVTRDVIHDLAGFDFKWRHRVISDALDSANLAAELSICFRRKTCKV